MVKLNYSDCFCLGKSIAFVVVTTAGNIWKPYFSIGYHVDTCLENSYMFGSKLVLKVKKRECLLPLSCEIFNNAFSTAEVTKGRNKPKDDRTCVWCYIESWSGGGGGARYSGGLYAGTHI
jgi:hypothetical protein